MSGVSIWIDMGSNEDVPRKLTHHSSLSSSTCRTHTSHQSLLYLHITNPYFILHKQGHLSSTVTLSALE